MAAEDMITGRCCGLNSPEVHDCWTVVFQVSWCVEGQVLIRVDKMLGAHNALLEK